MFCIYLKFLCISGMKKKFAVLYSTQIDQYGQGKLMSRQWEQTAICPISTNALCFLSTSKLKYLGSYCLTIWKVEIGHILYVFYQRVNNICRSWFWTTRTDQSFVVSLFFLEIASWFVLKYRILARVKVFAGKWRV